MDVRRSPLVSGDRDLVPDEVPELRARFGAVAGDWESASIAYVARRNGVRCLIIRGVTDLVGPDGCEIYDGTATLFRERAREVMTRLVAALPAWLDRVSW
jgi:adenosylhomocysteine nucleosidase